MGGCTSSRPVVDSPNPSLDSRQREITFFQNEFLRDFKDLELELGTVCYVFMVGFGKAPIQHDPVLLRATEKLTTKYKMDSGAPPIRYPLTGPFMVPTSTYLEGPPPASTDMATLRGNYSHIEHYGKQVVQGHLIKGVGTIRCGIDGITKRYDPWMERICGTMEVHQQGPLERKKGSGDVIKGRQLPPPPPPLPPSRQLTRQYEDAVAQLSADIEHVQLLLTPLIIQWLRDWLAHPNLYQYRPLFEWGAASNFRGYFTQGDLDAWRAVAEETKAAEEERVRKEAMTVSSPPPDEAPPSALPASPTPTGIRGSPSPTSPYALLPIDEPCFPSGPGSFHHQQSASPLNYSPTLHELQVPATSSIRRRKVPSVPVVADTPSPLAATCPARRASTHFVHKEDEEEGGHPPALLLSSSLTFTARSERHKQHFGSTSPISPPNQLRKVHSANLVHQHPPSSNDLSRSGYSYMAQYPAHMAHLKQKYDPSTHQQQQDHNMAMSTSSSSHNQPSSTTALFRDPTHIILDSQEEKWLGGSVRRNYPPPRGY